MRAVLFLVAIALSKGLYALPAPAKAKPVKRSSAPAATPTATVTKGPSAYERMLAKLDADEKGVAMCREEDRQIAEYLKAKADVADIDDQIHEMETTQRRQIDRMADQYGELNAFVKNARQGHKATLEKAKEEKAKRDERLAMLTAKLPTASGNVGDANRCAAKQQVVEQDKIWLTANDPPPGVKAFDPLAIAPTAPTPPSPSAVSE